MFWAALLVLSLSLSRSTTVTAMTFSNPRTRGAQAQAMDSMSTSNSNDMYTDGTVNVNMSTEQRRRHNRKAIQIQKKKDYSYENCPWSADQTIEHHMFRIFERPSQQASAYQTQAQRRNVKAQKAKAISYPALTVMFPHVPPHWNKHRHRTTKHADRRRLEDQAAAADDAYAYAAATDDAAAAATDDYYQGDDDAAAAATDDKSSTYDDDIFTGDNEMCSQFLVNFLEGTTDARDTCEGIQNAYVAAGTFLIDIVIDIDIDTQLS
jgi:hypothetical protein